MTDPETPTVERQVNRYFITGSGYVVGDNALGNVSVDLVPSPQGEWVRYADYLTLHAENQRLREEHARLKSQMLAVLVRDLGYTYRPAHGHKPLRHQFAWEWATEGMAPEALESDLARLRAEKEQP